MDCCSASRAVDVEDELPQLGRSGVTSISGDGNLCGRRLKQGRLSRSSQIECQQDIALILLAERRGRLAETGGNYSHVDPDRL